MNLIVPVSIAPIVILTGIPILLQSDFSYSQTQRKQSLT
jgi:hypothetical protein